MPGVPAQCSLGVVLQAQARNPWDLSLSSPCEVFIYALSEVRCELLFQLVQGLTPISGLSDRSLVLESSLERDPSHWSVQYFFHRVAPGQVIKIAHV